MYQTKNIRTQMGIAYLRIDHPACNDKTTMTAAKWDHRASDGGGQQLRTSIRGRLG
jgi:hypothetical protein